MFPRATTSATRFRRYCSTAASRTNSTLPPPPGPFDPAAHPYQRAHVGEPSNPYWSELLDYDGAAGSEVARRWLYESDYQLWSNGNYFGAYDPGDVYPDCPSDYGCGTNLDGKLWIYSDTTVGTVNANSPAGYRLNDLGVPDATNDVELSKHFTALMPDEPYFYGHCDLVFPEYYGPWRKYFEWWLPRDILGWDGGRYHSSLLGPLAVEKIGLIKEDGGAMLIDDLMMPRLGSLLLESSSLIMVSPAEPHPGMAPEMELGGPKALVFDPDQTRLVDAVYGVGVELGTSADVGLGWTPLAAGPSSREAAVPVYSRYAQRFFLVGGRFASGQPSGEIWMRSVGTGGTESWQLVALDARGYHPAEVLAATYSFRDHRLWILDEEAGTARLTRVHPETGFARVMASWRRSAEWDKQWLRLDQDGAVLLVSSSTELESHALARLSAAPFVPDAAVEVEDYSRRAGALLLRPVVDMRGYTLVFGNSKETWVERREALGGEPVALDVLDDVL